MRWVLEFPDFPHLFFLKVLNLFYLRFFITEFNLNTMNIVERYNKPTPKFFRILRNIGLGLASVGGALLALPIVLPAAVATAATTMIISGTVLSAVSQAAVQDPEAPKPEPDA